MKKTTLLTALRGAALAALIAGVWTEAGAKPARRGPITVEQPDGTTLTIRLSGDEFGHATYTEDGYPLLYDETLGYVYADILSDGTLRASTLRASDAALRTPEARQFLSAITPGRIASAKQAVNRDAKARRQAPDAQRKIGLTSDATYPVTGEQRGLVILVEYSDVEFGSSTIRYDYDSYPGGMHGYWSDMMNKEGFDVNDARGSVRDWFLYNSRDEKGNPQFIPTFDVYGPVTLPNVRRYYGQNNFYGNDKAAYQMVTDALTILDPEVDFSQYDCDGDGYIDNVYVFYAGFGEADGGNSYTVWPHSWHISYGDEKVYRYDGVIADRYACSNETDFSTKMPDGIGTFVHEFSHVMGLPDLYCTEEGKYPYTPGQYSVMDYGPYNGGGHCPPNYSTYERYSFGWISPKQVPAEADFELPALVETNEAYKIWTGKKTEFYLVENRRQEGWDEFIPGHGMLVWHVDYVPDHWDYNTVNNNPSHQYVDMIEANRKRDTRYADGHPFPGTSKVTEYTFKTWDGEETGVVFTDISETEEGTILVVGTNSGYDPELDKKEDVSVEGITAGDDAPAEYYNLQGIRLSAPVKGEVTIVKQGRAVTKRRF